MSNKDKAIREARKIPTQKGLRVCLNCGDEFQPMSNAQKYCSREENPECDDDRHYQTKWDKGNHPLQKINQ